MTRSPGGLGRDLEGGGWLLVLVLGDRSDVLRRHLLEAVCCIGWGSNGERQ